jgi:hypothetical protein
VERIRRILREARALEPRQQQRDAIERIGAMARIDAHAGTLAHDGVVGQQAAQGLETRDDVVDQTGGIVLHGQGSRRGHGDPPGID